MAVAPVNLCPDLQAWYLSGLQFVLLENSNVAEILSSAPSMGHKPQRPEQDNCQMHDGMAYSPESRSLNSVHSDAKSSSHFSESKALKEDESLKKTRLQSVNNYIPNSSHGVADPSAQHGLSALPSLPEPELWPQPWNTIFKRVKPAPIIWSYRELGEDLLEKGNPERSHALRQLIGKLELKKGSNSFLPFFLPGLTTEEQSLSPALFQHGLSRLKAKIIVVFGKESLAECGYHSCNLNPFQEQIIAGKLLLLLPNFSELLTEPLKLESATIFLRSAFSRLHFF